MQSRRVLILFSGPYNRPDGLGAFLARMGIEAVLVDNSANGGDKNDDLRSKSIFESLLQRCHKGEFFAVFAAPPCSTFSVARFFKAVNAPSPVRDRENINGLPHLKPSPFGASIIFALSPYIPPHIKPSPFQAYKIF